MHGIRRKLSSLPSQASTALLHPRVAFYSSSSSPSPSPSPSSHSEEDSSPLPSPSHSLPSDPASLPLPNGALANGAHVNGAYMNGAYVNGAYVNGANGAHQNGFHQNGALQNGLHNKPNGYHKSPEIKYKDLTEDELLNLIMERKQANHPQEFLNFLYLIMAYRKTRNTRGIIDAVVNLKEAGLEPNAHMYNMLISHFGAVKDPKTAKEIYQKMRKKGFELGDGSFYDVLQGFLNAPNSTYYREGVEIFENAVKRNIALPQGCYYTLITRSVEMEDNAVCKTVLSEMTRHGIQPPDSKDIFGMQISTLFSKKKYEEVLHKYAEMRSLNLYPTYNIFDIVLQSAALLNDALRVRSVFADQRATMGERPLPQLRIIEYAKYVRELAQIGDIDGCFDAIVQMRADGIKLNFGVYTPIYNHVTKTEDVAGITRLQSEMAVDELKLTGNRKELVEKILASGGLTDVRTIGAKQTVHEYNIQLAKLVKQEDHTAVSKAVSDMAREGIAFDLATYNILLAHAASKEQHGEVRRLHAQLLASGLRADATIYHSLAQGYSHMKDVRACTQLVDDMLRASIQLQASHFQRLLVIIVASGDLARCSEMLTRMRKPAQATLDVPTYGLVIDLMLQHGDMMGCNRMLSEMQAKGVKPSLAIYNSLIGFAAAKGDKNWVSILLNELATQGLRPDMSTYTRLFEGMALFGDAEGCELWVETMRNNGLSPTRAIYHSIIQAKAMRGDAEACSRIVREMGVRGMRPDAQAYTTTIAMLVRKGDQYNCRAVYEDMRRMDVVPEREVFNSVALISSTPDAMKLISDMRGCNVLPDADTYRAVLGNMAWRGDIDGCRMALVEMERDGVVPDMATYNNLVVNLGKQADVRALCNRLLECIAPQGSYAYPGVALYTSPATHPLSNIVNIPLNFSTPTPTTTIVPTISDSNTPTQPSTTNITTPTTKQTTPKNQNTRRTNKTTTRPNGASTEQTTTKLNGTTQKRTTRQHKVYQNGTSIHDQSQQSSSPLSSSTSDSPTTSTLSSISASS